MQPNKQAPEVNTCSGFCGVNYCDEYGCMEAVQYHDAPIKVFEPQPEPIFIVEGEPYPGEISRSEALLFLLILALAFAGVFILITKTRG